MKTSLFYLPSIGSRAEIEKGLAGLDGSRMLSEIGAGAAARAAASSLALRLDLQRPDSHPALMKSIETFATKILPRFA